MNQIAREYKQAIIIGASPMGNEAAQLLALLRWAGYGAQEESCTRDCATCRSGCRKPEMKKDIYVIAADGGLGFLLKNKLRPDFLVGDLDSIKYDDILTEAAVKAA